MHLSHFLIELFQIDITPSQQRGQVCEQQREDTNVTEGCYILTEFYTEILIY
jgi:hypothetical protein